MCKSFSGIHSIKHNGPCIISIAYNTASADPDEVFTTFPELDSCFGPFAF